MRGAALLAIALSGCTLLAHDTADLPSCEANAECEAINARFGIAADACTRYQCDRLGDAVCVLGARDDDGDGDPAIACGGTDCDDADDRRRGDRAPGEEESCDGVDDDCDRVIDEGAFASGEPRVVAAEVAPTAISAPTDATGALAVALSSGAGAGASVQVHFIADDGGSGPIAGSVPIALEYYTQEETGDPFTSFTRTGPGVCYSPPSTCNMRDAALGELDPAAGRWLLAAVNSAGCADGQLRVAWVDRGSGDALTMGPPARAAPAFGVDVDPSVGACTGTLSGGATGASQPSLAVLAAPGGPQALLTYAARPVAAGCGGPEAEVRAIGLWVTAGTIGGRAVAWVDATGANHPVTLGTTRGRARAAVAALDEPAGYLVAHAGPSEIVLSFVPAFQTIGDEDVESCLPDRCDEPHTTHDIEAVALGTVPAGGADEVAIAIGAVRGARRELGIVWQTGCGAAISGASFAVVSVDPEGQSPLEVSAMHALGGDRAGAPAIAYVPEGLVLEGYERGGAVADAEHDGGWIVVWREEARLSAQRFSELDGEAIDDPVTIAAGVSSRPELGAREGSPARFGVVSTSGALLGGALGCSSP